MYHLQILTEQHGSVIQVSAGHRVPWKSSLLLHSSLLLLLIHTNSTKSSVLSRTLLIWHFLKDFTTLICFTIKISAQSCNTKKLPKLPQQDQLSHVWLPLYLPQKRSSFRVRNSTVSAICYTSASRSGCFVYKKCVYSCQTSEFLPLPICPDISFS
jgi:hypothetical protein